MEEDGSRHGSDQGNSQQDDQPTQTEELVPKRGGTSVAWTWFGYKKTDVDQTTVVCKVCRLPVPTTDSNTTNLFYHLRKNHEKDYRESQRAKTANSRHRRCNRLLPVAHHVAIAPANGRRSLLLLPTVNITNSLALKKGSK